jgi:hypothetical protein
MQISLDEAINIHGRALKSRLGVSAVPSSRERAARCRAKGDFEGETVWLRVVEAIQELRDEDEQGSLGERARH